MFQALTGRMCLLLPLMYCHYGRALPTQPFQVTASVVNGCVVSGTDTGTFGTLDFGTESGVGNSTVSASFVQNSTLNLACTPGTTLNMRINGGNHYGTTRNLKLAGNSDTVGYRLYTSATHSASSEIPVDQNVALNYSDASNITLPVYGLLQLSGVHQAGTYSDTLIVTLSW